ncbi:hypothetical protein CCMSSC00406_0004125 [Pleurotus cornucopiae]|uniref:Uncharacterized protein n=1 Tax=Pleurotus cornucopiae TaxID=5321 RepID=A0ACB7JB73_PLECO|nr:hypothetical protein CCMSSC00406_0004125 [Pleurotus cornucopiae]
MHAGPWLVVTTFLLTHVVVANPLRRAPPVVTLDSATVTGTQFGRVNRYLGIPFAQSPVGDLRFRRPEPIAPYTESFSALTYGKACPQQDVQLSLPGILGLADSTTDFLTNTAWGVALPDGEDCLTINVVTPASATPALNLPVIVWIYGGGFQIGSSSLYDGGSVVEKSISMGEPVIFWLRASIRLAFGFLASQEVKDAGVANLGLHDQREALRWVQKYIHNFGGDPTKVTIWGESAGAVSVSMHMVANDGDTEGLYRAAVMQSGTPVPVGDVTKAQVHYNNIVENTGCSGESDTLACLRTLDYEVLKGAVDQTPSITGYNTLVLPWLPRTDGTFIREDGQRLVQQGKIANVPYIVGDCDDEGTLFALILNNLTTTSDVRGYLKDVWIPDATPAELDQILALYPADITKGSPFDTQIFNALTPQFKRVAALLGDAAFQAPRRMFLDHSADTQNTWSFLSKRLKATPFLGSFHASDLLNSFGSGDLAEYIIHFTNALDPNGNGITSWPKYTADTRKLMTFQDQLLQPRIITQDNYRQEAIAFLTAVMLAHPI